MHSNCTQCFDTMSLTIVTHHFRLVYNWIGLAQLVPRFCQRLKTLGDKLQVILKT